MLFCIREKLEYDQKTLITIPSSADKVFCTILMDNTTTVVLFEQETKVKNILQAKKITSLDFKFPALPLQPDEFGSVGEFLFE